MVASRIPRAGSLEENQFPAIFPGTSQVLAITGTQALSAVFASETTIIRVVATKDCFLEIGGTPVADATKCFLPAGIIEYFGAREGDKLAVIKAGSGASGTLYLTEGGK